MCGRFTNGTPQKIEDRFKTSNKLSSFKPTCKLALDKDGRDCF